MNISNKQDILLESGTNELEILEFVINEETFGINVAKVREIMMYQSLKPMQKANPFIEGIFKPRDKIITVLNLPKYLGFESTPNPEKDIFVVTFFNKLYMAFHVHSVSGIIRISWNRIEKPDKTIYGGEEGIVTGIAEYDGRLITILDFEKIVYDISPQTGIQMSELKQHENRPERQSKRLLIVEDSALLGKMIIDSLEMAGYTNSVKCTNGQEAWAVLSEAKEKEESISEFCSIVITDIEMPQMDGHHLTKMIKEDPVLQKLPVIIFSSLIDDEMFRKGEQVGADAQITKPEVGRLVDLVDQLVFEQK